MDAAQLRACRNYYVQLLKKLAADERPESRLWRAHPHMPPQGHMCLCTASCQPRGESTYGVSHTCLRIAADVTLAGMTPINADLMLRFLKNNNTKTI